MNIRKATSALSSIALVAGLFATNIADAKHYHYVPKAKQVITSTPAAATTTVVTPKKNLKKKPVPVPTPTPAPSPTPTPTPAPSPTPVATSWTTTVFDGYGSVNWNSDFTQLTISPKASTQPSETHSTLVTTNTSYNAPYEVTFTMKTTQQLRTGSTPNPWEVGWFGFGYTPEGKFKYLTLKPNGLEAGESLLNNAQTFLYTSSDAFPINTDYNVDMTVANNVITVKVNGKQYMQYTMSSKDSLNGNGQFAFYTEDATVKFSNFAVKQL